MISLIIIWSYSAIIMIVYGVAAVKSLCYLFNIDLQAYPPLVVIFILGLCVVTTLSGYLSLFNKLGLGAFVLVSLLAFFIIYYYYQDITLLFKGYLNKLWSIEKYLIIIFGFCLIFILVKSSNPPASVDTGLYHAQAIRWIEEYRVVPGLGNLHGRLAFNCSWFLPSALFSFSLLKIQPFHVLNPLLLIFVLMMSVEAVDKTMKGHNSYANLLKIAIIIPVTLVFKEQLSSPNVDLPAALLLLVLFIYWIETLDDKMVSSSGMAPVVIAIIVAYVITVKLSSIPIMIFSVYIIGRKIITKQFSDTLMLFGIVFLIILPWIIRNIMLSGYLIYPFPSLDLFNFDWKVPLRAVVAESQAVTNYARNPGLIPDKLMEQGIAYWFPSWVSYVLRAYRKKLILIFLPAMFFVVGIIINRLEEKKIGYDYNIIRKYKIVYLTAFLGDIFWFITAPDIRLGLGFIMITPLLILMPITTALRPLVTRSLVLLVGIALLYFEIVFMGGDLASVKTHLILPSPYPVASLEVYPVDGKVVYVPEDKGGQCWYASLPCAPGPVPGLEFRGNSLQDGFRPKKW